MKLVRPALLALTCAFAATAYSQESIVGKYTGTIQGLGTNRPYGGAIEIKSIEGGKVVGTFHSYARAGCSGAFAVSGTASGDKLEFASDPGGKTNDCLERKFEVTADGKRLTGRMMDERGNWREVVMTK